MEWRLHSRTSRIAYHLRQIVRFSPADRWRRSLWLYCRCDGLVVYQGLVFDRAVRLSGVVQLISYIGRWPARLGLEGSDKSSHVSRTYDFEHPISMVRGQSHK